MKSATTTHIAHKHLLCGPDKRQEALLGRRGRTTVITTRSAHRCDNKEAQLLQAATAAVQSRLPLLDVVRRRVGRRRLLVGAQVTNDAALGAARGERGAATHGCRRRD